MGCTILMIKYLIDLRCITSLKLEVVAIVSKLKLSNTKYKMLSIPTCNDKNMPSRNVIIHDIYGDVYNQIGDKVKEAYSMIACIRWDQQIG